MRGASQKNAQVVTAEIWVQLHMKIAVPICHMTQFFNCASRPRRCQTFRPSLVETLLLHLGAYYAGQVLQRHDRADDDQQDRGGGVKFITIKRGVQRGTDAAGTNDTQHCAFAKF